MESSPIHIERDDLGGLVAEPVGQDVVEPPHASPEPPTAEESAEGLTAGLEELGQEIRRVGRELFKVNRAAERNADLFEDTLGELRQLTASVVAATRQGAD